MAEALERDPKSSDLQSKALAEYKTVLRRVLDNRPSGTRRRLAEQLGKNRSFISQISNPAYSTPIPVQYVEQIIRLCHFSPGERSAFLDAYTRAHPRRAKGLSDHPETRQLTLSVPDLGDPDLNAAYDHLIMELAERIGRLMLATKTE